MRADLANSNDDAIAPHEVGEGEGKGSAACRQAEGSRRIACASGSSRCGEVLAQLHPPTRSVRAGSACAQQPQVRVEARDDGPHSRDGLDLLWLLMPDTALAKNRADNPSDRPGRRLAG